MREPDLESWQFIRNELKIYLVKTQHLAFSEMIWLFCKQQSKEMPAKALGKKAISAMDFYQAEGIML